MRSWLLLAGLLIAAPAGAGTVASMVFSSERSAEVVIANGVAAAKSGEFVLYEHGAWKPRPNPGVVATVMAPQIVSLAAPIAVTNCGSLAPSPHRGLAAATAVGRAAYWPLIRDAECRHALPPGLLDAVVFQESRYRPFAVSAAGAGGLTQLMPRTASGLGVTNRFEPIANVDGGARYLRSMLDHYRSVPLAVAAYNAGRGSVDRWGGIPHNRETPGYVQKVLGFFNDVDNTLAPATVPATVAQVVSLTFGALGDLAN